MLCCTRRQLQVVNIERGTIFLYEYVRVLYIYIYKYTEKEYTQHPTNTQTYTKQVGAPSLRSRTKRPHQVKSWEQHST